MVLLRPFAEEDNATLLEIEKLCPQGNDKIAEAGDRSPDAIARYRLYDNWKVFVAEENNEIAGWIGWTLKQNLAGEKYAYLVEVIVHPKFQRKGIATKLIEKAETDMKENGASHVYGYVFEPNDASNTLFAKKGYEKVGEMQIHAVFAYKEAKVIPELSIRTAKIDDIQEIVDLINEFNAGRVHFVPYTAKSFETHIKNIPGYGMDNLWIALSNDRIVACTGLWDISMIEKLYYAKEPFSMKVMGVLCHFLDHFTNVPRIPAENEAFTNHQLADYAFRPGSAEAMLNLIRHLNNTILDSQSIAIAALLTPDDPMVEVMKRLKPLEEKWNIIAKSLDDNSANLTPLYMDLRDFIM